MVTVRKCLRLLAALCFSALLSLPIAIAQDARQNQDKLDAPTATGKVAAYEPDKSITIEIPMRGGAKTMEFAVVKEKTRIELPPRLKEIKVGMVLSVWADKDNTALAAKIGTGTSSAAVPGTRRPNRRPANLEPPGVSGQVAAYEADKSITVEVRQRGGQSRKTEFSIVEDQTKIEFVGDTKEIAVGMPVSIWPDKDNAKVAGRIVAGATNAPMPRARRPNLDQPSSTTPAKSVTPVVTRPARQPVAGLAPLAVAQQIDQQIQARLEADKIPASPPCDDAEFLRRVYLDVTGVIPPADKAAAFLDNDDPNKRARLIDELLASEDYGRHFGDLWCERIASRDLPTEKQTFIQWLADGLNQGRGWDELVFDLLTAEGSFTVAARGKRMSATEPPAFFVLVNTEGSNSQPAKVRPEWLAAESARLFLGVQIQCAECHDHPFTPQWKQTDFWGMAAFFGQFSAERNQPMGGGLQWQETPAAAGEPVSIVIPPTALKSVGTTVPARLLGGDKEYQPTSPELLRHSLARWMTSPDNRLFAKATANRLWAHFFGRGLVNPVDDLRDDNPPSHPAVLELLADETRKSQFDLKHLIRCVCLSQTYQRTSLPLPDNEQDRDRYSHMAIKVMGPGVFYDSLAIATGFPEMKLGLPERKTIVTTITNVTPREAFVGFFRSSLGEEADPLEYQHGIPQKLKLLNAAQLNRVAPVVERMAHSGLARDQVIEQLYLTALARRPTVQEARLMTDFLERRKETSREEGYSAVLWVLINSSEFVLNH